ncbi:MAG: J domain-containing protein [Candidatus Omnitrophota bacterium]|nr:MAG: J domain-containing protein [Candidatus Omnitrophota bacterium]
MIDFKQIDEARKLLGLDEEASLEEIKKAYRDLSFKYHPDRCKEIDKKHCEEMMRRINEAKNIIMTYCAGYRFSFREKDVRKNLLNKELYQHLKRFYEGWWGNLEV